MPKCSYVSLMWWQAWRVQSLLIRTSITNTLCSGDAFGHDADNNASLKPTFSETKIFHFVCKAKESEQNEDGNELAFCLATS